MVQKACKKDPMCFPEIEWFLPRPKEIIYSINIPNDVCFNFNQKLLEKIPYNIKIGISEDGKRLSINKDMAGFSVPKSGTLKVSFLICAIKARGIHLPAHYKVERKDDCWFANYISPSVPLSHPRSTTKEVSSKKLKKMIPGGG